MIRVLHVITSFDIGGAERVAFNIAKSKSENFEYHIVEIVHSHSSFSSQVVEELENDGIFLHFSPIYNKKIGIMFFWIWFGVIYLRVNPQIIHSHTEIPDLSLWIFRKLAWIFRGITPKYVRTIHNTQLWNDWGAIGRRVEPFYIQHNSNIAISHSTKYSYEKQFGISDIPIIYNGLQESIQKSFRGVVKEKVNVLFAGRLEYQKGIEQLISVVKALSTDNRYHFYIVGSGTLTEKLHDDLKGFDSVTLYEKIYGLSNYLSSFDFIFMPSNFEGFGLLSAEASLAHVPTIINDCPGLNETLPADWLLKVENNNVAQYLHIFKDILPNVDKMALGEQAYSFAKAKFGLRKMQEEYEKAYTMLLVGG